MILFTSASLLLLAFLRLRCFLGGRFFWLFFWTVAAFFRGSFRLFGWDRFFSFRFGLRCWGLFFGSCYRFLRGIFRCWRLCFGSGVRGLSFWGFTFRWGCTFRRWGSRWGLSINWRGRQWRAVWSCRRRPGRCRPDGPGSSSRLGSKFFFRQSCSYQGTKNFVVYF
jgi:hypothetical protein